MRLQSTLQSGVVNGQWLVPLATYFASVATLGLLWYVNRPTAAWQAGGTLSGDGAVAAAHRQIARRDASNETWPVSR